MNADSILTRLRTFLLAFAVVIFAGTLVELAFINHTKETVQIIPFVLCATGIIAVILVLIRPRRLTLMILRYSTAIIILGSLIGVYEHVTNNLAFALEIHPNLSTMARISSALGGANPLMAPGILAMAAILATAATYYHPALDQEVFEASRPMKDQESEIAYAHKQKDKTNTG